MAQRREDAKNTFVFIDNRNGDYTFNEVINELMARGGFYVGLFKDCHTRKIWTTNKYGVICFFEANELMNLQSQGYKQIFKSDFITK